MATTRTIRTQIALRRDTEANFNAIKDTFKPLKGEICFVDTDNGLKVKVGDGEKTFSTLKYINEDHVSKFDIIQGFYYLGSFYEDAYYSQNVAGDVHKIYIDKATGKFYYWENNSFKENMMSLPTATAAQPGILKIYETQGTNTDGTITQKFFTEAIDSLILTVDDEDPSCLVFKKLW